MFGENDGFPLPCSEEELKAFDEDVFVEYPSARRRKKKDRQRSKSATNVPDLATLRLKLQKIQSPSKPKFLEHLISRVSKKVSQDTNGLINALPLDTDDPVTDEPLSPDSEQCLEVVESLAEELIACTQRPASGESYDSGQGSSLLESTSDFSPTSKRKSWSTPTSPTFQGIVKQRLKNFQAIRETSLPPGELEKSPARKTKSLCSEKRELEETQLSARRFHCSLRQGDERFTQAVMESGYVKALVSRLNKSTSFDKDNDNDDLSDTRRVSDDVVNGVKVNLKEDNVDDWPDEFGEFGVGEEIDNSESTGKSPSKSHSVKDQLKKFETCSSKTNTNISSTSTRRKKSGQSIGATDNSNSDFCRPSDSPKKDLGKQQTTLTESPDAVSSSESLTDSGKSTKTFSELQTQEEEAEEEPKDKLHKIAYELLTTERAYVTRLHLLDQVFHFRVTVENKNGSFIPPDVVTQVFSHIKPIYQFHHDFLLPQLETRMKNWSQEQRIGDIIAKLAPFLKLYTEYVKNFDNSMNLINKWTNQSPKFASLLQEIQKEPECGQLSLQHHMLGPIQRVPRYELLLKEYLKCLDPESPDKAEAEKALDLVTEAARHSNTTMDKLKKFEQLLGILQNLNGEGIHDLVSPTRELVKEGPITKISARSGEKQDRYLFLFNDLLLVCISQLMGKYKVRARLSVDGMDVLPGENLSIQNTFCIKCTEKSVEFLDVANNGEGLDWLAAFEIVITDFLNKMKLNRVMSDEVTGSKVALKDHEVLGSQLLGKRAPKWIKDEEVTMCMEYTCQDKFTRIRRRHHCRACGKIFCGKCSSRKVQLEYDNNQSNRVCQKCYETLKGDNHLEEPTTHKPVTQVEADQSSVLSCYLNVMDNVKGRTWNKRWITVRDDFVLYFYKKHKDPKAMHTMPLPGHEVKVMDGTEKLDRQHVFALSHKAVNVCYFQTENDGQLHQWTEVLKKMVLLELPSEEDKRLSAHSLDSSNSTNSSTGS